MESPEAFFKGLGKGAKGLLKGFASGTTASASAFLGVASKSLATGK